MAQATLDTRPTRIAERGIERLLATVRVIWQLHREAVAEHPGADPDQLLDEVVRRVQPHAGRESTWR